MLRGDTLVACGRLEEAVEAYGHGVALGGWGAARAAHSRGFVLERLGSDGAADFELARRMDHGVDCYRASTVTGSRSRDRLLRAWAKSTFVRAFRIGHFVRTCFSLNTRESGR